MKNLVRFLMVAITGLLMSGCMEVESLVKVKADGSGTIEQTILMSSALVDMMKGMGEEMSGNSEEASKSKKDSKKSQSPLIKEDELKAAAAKMGQGVSFIGVVEHKSKTGEGYIATYAFTDINKVIIDQNPGASAPSGGGDGDNKAEPLRFIFTKGESNTSVLTIKSPTGDAVKEGKEEAAEDKAKKDTPTEEEKASQEMAMGMMKQMFTGMRVAMIVEIEGDIIETNATHRNGNRITIMDMDFGALLANEDAFKDFTESKDQSIENAKKYMQDIPGIKIDMNEEITIKFK